MKISLYVIYEFYIKNTKIYINYMSPFGSRAIDLVKYTHADLYLITNQNKQKTNQNKQKTNQNHQIITQKYYDCYDIKTATFCNIANLFEIIPNDPNKQNVLLTYNTLYGSIPIIEINKNKLDKFIKDIENNIDSVLEFISDPLYEDSGNCQDEKLIFNDNKIYFMDYEDGHSKFGFFYTHITNQHIDNLKKILMSLEK